MNVVFYPALRLSQIRPSAFSNQNVFVFSITATFPSSSVSMATTSSPPNATDPADDSSSLVDIADFNRYPGEWPDGLKKRQFPDIYPKYAEDSSSPRKRSCRSNSSASGGRSWFDSSPVKEDRFSCRSNLGESFILSYIIVSSFVPTKACLQFLIF